MNLAPVFCVYFSIFAVPELFSLSLPPLPRSPSLPLTVFQLLLNLALACFFFFFVPARPYVRLFLLYL